MEDVKRMMTGKKSTFHSRMTFHYEFILKTFQLNTVRWIEIMNSSYWFRKHAKLIHECKHALDTFKLPPLSADEIREMEALDALKQRIKESVNAPRRQAQKELEAWKNRHMGPKWYALEKDWIQYLAAIQDMKGLEQELAYLNEPQRDVYPILQCLDEFGFMKDGTLTPLGTMATEVNEGHPILMPLFWTGITRAALTAEETLATLAVFLGEHEDTTPVSSSHVAASVEEIKRIAKQCMEIESFYGVVNPKSTYWNVSTEFVEVVWKWVHGSSLVELSLEYGIFEGNLIRILAKLQSVLEEWRVLATLTKQTDTLNMLDGAEKLLSIGFASSESLYLRL
jgi:superfamily II RNA helicase